MKEYRKSVLTFFGFLLVSVWLVAPLVAQQPVLKSEYSYRRYTTQDGLPNLITLSIFQDTKGFIWVGTLHGFARFDGHQFKTFDSQGQNILGFTEHNCHVIAIGLTSSFCVNENDSIVPLKMVHSASDTYCWHNSKYLPKGYAVYQTDSKKTLYAITDTGLVKTWEHELLNHMADGNELYWDKANRCFIISTEKQGTYIVNVNGTVEKHFDINAITNFIPYENALWAVGYKGLYEYRDGELKLILEYPFFSGESSDIQLLEDSEHNLLIRTISHLYRYSNGKLENITDNLLSSRDFFVDNEGNIWVATADGLFNYYKLNFKNYILQPEGSTTQSIVVDKQDRVWLPAFDGRIFRLTNRNEKIIKYPKSPTGYSFFERGSISKDNLLYLSGGACILKYNCDKDIFQWLPDFPASLIQYISVLPDEDLVAGNTETVMVYNSTEGIKHTYTMKELKQKILTSFTDKQGNIFLGGVEGLTIIKGDSIRYLTDNALKTCTYIINDNEGKLWLICGNRLITMENDSVRVEHVFSKDLCNLYITRSGIMLVTTIDELYIASDIKHLDFIRYDQNNGYVDAFGIGGTNVAEDMEGNIYISTIEKTVCFHPDKLLDKLQTPKFYIQNFESSADNINWKNFDMNRQLNYRQKNIRFSFIGLSYSAAQNVRYHYRLKGFQNNWSEPVKYREITFNNLPPGNYTFEIYADAGTDESRCETQTYAFEITPAFWQTWWFWTFSIVVLAGCLVWIIYYYLKKKQLEKIKRIEREKEMNELRVQSVRLKSIPHFNSNVLASIEYYIMAKSKEESNQLLTRYSRFTNITLHEIDKANRSLKDEIDYVRLYLELEKLRFGAQFSYSIDVDENTDTEIMIPNMVLHTYAENAVKHGIRGKNTPGHVSIKAVGEKNGVLLSVEDDGIGREESRRRDPDREGHGLKILNRQIELYNQQNAEKIVQSVVDLKDAEGNALGTRFEMFVPFNYQYL